MHSAPANLLPPQEFVNQLIARLSGADGLVEVAIDEYNKQVAKGGSETESENLGSGFAGYLENVMHKAKDINLRISGIEYFASTDRVPKFEYLSHAKETFEEAYIRFTQLFGRYPQFATIEGVLKPECQKMLDALASCVEFSSEQYALVAPSKQVGRT